MFGKNYDKMIGTLIEANNSHSESITYLRGLFDSTQESIMQMAIIQNQHKKIISFLMNHASVDANAQEDLGKMLQEIVQVEKDIKKKMEKK